MISTLEIGKYKLVETKGQTKILTLNNRTYAWINAEDIGEILVSSHKEHATDCILAIGDYKIYKVEDDPDYSDHIHLELNVGENTWQGYLLLTGLPTEKKVRVRIVPTNEVITK